MKTIKTSELTEAALDWAVAKCEGKEYISELFEVEIPFFYREETTRYSTNWAQGGPIIEREKISVGYQPSAPSNSKWYATNRQGSYGMSDIPLIAAMRCYVALKLGDEVEIPEELI